MDIAEQLALWADTLRDLSAAGLNYTSNPYDRQRYKAIQDLALQMLSLATAQPRGVLEPLRATVFARPSPVLAGTGAVIDASGAILLMRRSDTGRWCMPGGMLEVGETPAAGIEREVYEETGVRCRAEALVGIYDSRRCGTRMPQHLYKLTLLCRPLPVPPAAVPSHAQETLAIDWFAEHALPQDLHDDHARRIEHAFQVWRGARAPFFDREEIA